MGSYRNNLTKYWKQYSEQYEIPKGFHVHHITPRSCGGSDDANNLIALHPDDHVAIHNNRGDKITPKFIYVIGKKNSPETRAKIGRANKGKIVSQSTRDLLRASRLGTKMSTATRAKMSDVRKNVAKSDEHKRKIGESQRGKIISNETKAKQSEGHSSKKVENHITCEHCGIVNTIKANHTRWHGDKCKARGL